MRLEGRALCLISAVGSTRESSLFPDQDMLSVWLKEVGIAGPHSRGEDVFHNSSLALHCFYSQR